MNLWKKVRRMVQGEQTQMPPRPPILAEDEPEAIVPEISPMELQALLAQDDAPLLIDIREAYEWRLVRVPFARHVPMNEVPGLLESLPRDRAIVVMCAHGSRSYSVAAWLIEQGLEASSLAGGISQWAHEGGTVEQG
jgi:rhodanese-related sulfurtransferase